MGGDFNCPGIEWSTGSLTDSYLPVNFRESLIVFAQDFFLEQIITEPTRGKNTLDLCFTSHPRHIHQFTIVPGLSDHDAIIMDILIFTPCNTKLKKKVYCFNKADWISLHEKVCSMSTDYFQLNETSSRSVHENWNYFHKNLMHAVDTHIPIKYISSTLKPPWMTPELNRLIKKKQRTYNKAKNSKIPADWTAYKNIQHQVRHAVYSNAT